MPRVWSPLVYHEQRRSRRFNFQQLPGHPLRELRNVLEHAILWSTGRVLTDNDISNSVAAMAMMYGNDAATERPPDHSADESMAALEAHHWNRTATARSLGIDRTTLWLRLKRLGVGEDHRNS